MTVEIENPFSEKQLQSIVESNARLNIWQGAVRSGKTFASIYKLMSLLKSAPPGDFLIVGFTRSSIQRNVVCELCRMIGANPPPSKNTEFRLAGRQIYLIGANDERAVSRIQGSTISVAYVDEATTVPPAFWKMLLSRLSIKGSQLLATCNPEGPAHWLKKEFIDNEDKLDLKTWKFLLDDNPSLSDEYKENLKKEYSSSPVWYKRYILGEWTLAAGMVYDGFDDDNVYTHEDQMVTPSYYIVGLDYGITNPTAACMVAVTPNTWPQLRVIDEYYYDSSQSGRGKTDAELADDIVKFVSWRPIQALYIDPSAASLKLELQRRNVPTVDGLNDVLLGIKIVSKFISGKNLIINKSCKHLIEEIQGYQWDSKAADRGVDKPVKENDHCNDCLRYCIASNFPTGELYNANEGISMQMRRQKAFGDNQSLFESFGLGHG
jgi:PBSX family phage terminase large subunit